MTSPGPVFVLNSGRCGSTYLAALLRENGVDARHEPDPDLWTRHVMRAKDPAGAADVREVLEETRPICHVEVNNRLCLFGAELVEVFPDATFIHLHRDGRDSVTSQLSNALEVDLRDIYGGDTEFEGACYWWLRTNLGCMVPRGLGAEYRALAFEDLVRDGGKGLWESVLGDPLETVSIEPRNVTDKHRDPVWPDPGDWEKMHAAFFREVCGALQRRLGRGVSPP